VSFPFGSFISIFKNGIYGAIMKKILSAVLLSSIMLLGGCATIMGDKTQVMPVSSSPSDATIKITDERGIEVFKGTTPTNVTLQKSDGSYWGKKSFIVEISKPGFATQTIPVKANANGWYIGGNILFGGLIGWFIVDPMTGAMYTLSPEQVKQASDEKMTHNNSSAEGISIVLLEDVPDTMRSEMKKLN
jgi:hypothetical protein